MRLSQFNNAGFSRGAPKLKEALWIACSGLLFSSWIPGSRWRVSVLRLFGASIGRGVVIKPSVVVKFPWRLTIGDDCWIGEGVWIDNLAAVELASDVCVSQGAYFCTGSHDIKSVAFDLIVKPIHVGSHAWICARSSVGPGVSVGEGAVLSLASTATRALEPWGVYAGSPASLIRHRELASRAPS